MVLIRLLDELVWTNIQITNLQPPLPRDLDLSRKAIAKINAATSQDFAPWQANDDFVALFTNSNERFDRFTNWVFEKLGFFHNYIYPFRVSTVQYFIWK